MCIRDRHEVIPHFHDTPARFRQLMDAVREDKAGRLKNVADELEFAKARETDCGLLMNLLEKGKLPLKVTHNDTKMSNVLIDNATVSYTHLDVYKGQVQGSAEHFIGHISALCARDGFQLRGDGGVIVPEVFRRFGGDGFGIRYRFIGLIRQNGCSGEQSDKQGQEHRHGMTQCAKNGACCLNTVFGFYLHFCRLHALLT